ncbi:uncharacterized protein LOC111373985 [Olea europaea var. sylvestris]|uniref:uncharacterized protein LOC111373985 n=1 Tax=Olea europaea var. sylvestris TaxID=158386 RepID=UPI000C1CEDC6|nr:uncharacterized protein LOC111373985 [Olea europaea var. sylvestris]
MCVDSKAINKITVNCRFPILSLDDILDQLSSSKIFSKMDHKSGYHQIRIRPGDEWKTAFKMQHGLYEWMVMSFGLSNTPSTFMRNFSTRIAPITKCLKGRDFQWTKKTEAIFQLVKQKMTEAPILALSNFESVFKVNCDASGVGISGVLNFEALVSLPGIERVRPYHEALKYINGQHRLSRQHVKWVAYLQEFTFALRHQAESLNRVADTLSHRTLLLTIMSTRVVRSEAFLNMYAADLSFGKIIQEIISELHNEEHFRRDKTLVLVSSNYYWPKLSSDVAHYVEQCYVCQKSKGALTSVGRYTPLPVPEAPWFNTEFAYNRSKNRTTGLSPFEVTYGQKPSGVLDLALILCVGRFIHKADEMAEHLRGIHEQVKLSIQESNSKYKAQADSHHH